MKTKFANPQTVVRQWHLVDASNAVVGRAASQIAAILRGKHKPTYTPHTDTGDFVVVVNAEKVRFSGNKEQEKLYWRHTGYPGGERSVTPEKQREKYPERIMFAAIKGMLPKGPLGRQMLTKLRVYSGTEHGHQAQQPQPLTLK